MSLSFSIDVPTQKYLYILHRHNLDTHTHTLPQHLGIDLKPEVSIAGQLQVEIPPKIMDLHMSNVFPLLRGNAIALIIKEEFDQFMQVFDLLLLVLQLPFS